MGRLTEDIKRVVREQRLGFYATVCEDGSPNLSPKGTTFVLDDEHLLFADIRSPQTVENVRRGSQVEVNVVDPLVRKGYRFKGPAEVHEPGSPRDRRDRSARRAGPQLARVRRRPVDRGRRRAGVAGSLRRVAARAAGQLGLMGLTPC